MKRGVTTGPLRASRRLHAVIVLLALPLAATLVGGCGPTWRGAAIRDAETRRSEAIVDLTTTLRISATRITPDLAVALAERRCDARQCGDERPALIAAARAAAERKTSFVFAVYTAKLAWNDLAEPESQWTLSLSAGGTRVAPSDIRGLRDLDSQARLYPDVDGFDKAYEVSFPVSPVESGLQRLTCSGLHGEVRLEWRSP